MKWSKSPASCTVRRNGLEARGASGNDLRLGFERLVNALWIAPYHTVGATYLTPHNIDASKARR